MKKRIGNVPGSVMIGLATGLAGGLGIGIENGLAWGLAMGAATALAAALAFGLATDAIASAVAPAGSSAPEGAVAVGGRVTPAGSLPEPQVAGAIVQQRVDQYGHPGVRFVELMSGEDTVHNRQLVERRLVQHPVEPASGTGLLVKGTGRLARLIITEVGSPAGLAVIQLWDKDEESSTGTKIGPKLKVHADETLPVDLDVPFGSGIFLEVVGGTVEVMIYEHGSSLA